MYQRVKSYIEEHHMLEKEDRVIVGVSGGADSVCLLFMLKKLRDERKASGDGRLKITAVHVHHGLRGASADADERYVRKICEEWDVPLVVYHKEVKKLAKHWNMSEEEAGRRARREAFLEVRAQSNNLQCTGDGERCGIGEWTDDKEPCNTAGRINDEEQCGIAGYARKQECGYGKIALAHHRNDDAETVLFHLCRGTDVRGLGGIAPVSGFWIRPLLNIGRNEIESYLEKMGISYCTDETNGENVYARNKLRNQVIPQLEEINEQAVRHISRAAQSVRELWSYVDGQIEEYKEKCLGRHSKIQSCTEKTLQSEPQSCAGKELQSETQSCGEKIIISKMEYEKVPAPLQSYVIHRIICETAGHEKDISAVHVQAVQELLDRQVGRKIDLPYEVTASRIYDGVQFKKKTNISAKISDLKEQDIPAKSGTLPEQKLLSVPEILAAPDNRKQIQAACRDIEIKSRDLFHFRIFERLPGMEAFPEKTYTKWFDYDIINNTVEIRHRQAGDILTINKNGGKQRLKKYFINEKISQEERDQIWLVADGHEIMWVVGYRQSQSYQITESTKNILEIQFCKGENYGRDSKSIS